jgi:hypothetical protein
MPSPEHANGPGRKPGRSPIKGRSGAPVTPALTSRKQSLGPRSDEAHNPHHQAGEPLPAWLAHIDWKATGKHLDDRGLAGTLVKRTRPGTTTPGLVGGARRARGVGWARTSRRPPSARGVRVGASPPRLVSAAGAAAARRGRGWQPPIRPVSWAAARWLGSRSPIGENLTQWPGTNTRLSVSTTPPAPRYLDPVIAPTTDWAPGGSCARRCQRAAGGCSDGTSASPQVTRARTGARGTTAGARLGRGLNRHVTKPSKPPGGSAPGGIIR